MQIDHLEEFSVLSETLNFTKAAQRCNITQPALSKHISQLEDELGSKLFFRDQRRVRLSAFGEKILPHARNVIWEKRNMMEIAERQRSGIDGELTIGYIEYPGAQLIINAHEPFIRNHPNVQMIYRNFEIDAIRTAMIESQLDLAITILTPDIAQERYHIAFLGKGGYSLVAAADHPLAKLNRPLKPTDLRGETIVMPSERFYPQQANALKKYLKPSENGIFTNYEVGSINDAPLTIAMENYLAIVPSIIEHHFANYPACEYRLLSLVDCPLFDQYVAIWRRTNEQELLPVYVEELKKASQDNSEDNHLPSFSHLGYLGASQKRQGL